MEPKLKLSILDRIALVGATWFGSGLLPIMPGTWGTMAAFPLVAVLAYYFSSWNYVVATIIVTILSIPFAHRAMVLNQTHPQIAAMNPHKKAVFKEKKLQQFIKDEKGQIKDPGMIVIDEVAGYAAAMIFIPFSFTALFLAFIFFRVFDVIKPEPGRLMEKIGGGVGIVLDDTVAGLYACLAVHICIMISNYLNLPAWI